MGSLKLLSNARAIEDLLVFGSVEEFFRSHDWVGPLASVKVTLGVMSNSAVLLVQFDIPIEMLVAVCSLRLLLLDKALIVGKVTVDGMFNAQVGIFEVTLTQGNCCWLVPEVGVKDVTSANGQNWIESGNDAGKVMSIWSW
jgi:hypothetical protein